MMHLVGVAGMLSPFKEYFKLLTPVNLLLSAFLLWINHREKNKGLIGFISFTFLFGFIIEFLGVRYGLLFGEYTYGKTLGPMLFQVPVIIGLNWLLVIYSIATLTDTLKIHSSVKVFLGALLAVSIDWVIEPVAMRYDFWAWKGEQVPIQNYIGWFFTSSVLLTAYHLLKVKAENKLALPYYFIQFLFFVVISLAILF
jgi:putative membrane protein